MLADRQFVLVVTLVVAIFVIGDSSRIIEECEIVSGDNGDGRATIVDRLIDDHRGRLFVLATTPTLDCETCDERWSR